MSLLNLVILLPTFTLLNESKYSVVLTDQFLSPLDEFTLADALMNPQIVTLVLILTLLYSALSLYILSAHFTLPMSHFSFPQEQSY